MSANNNANSLAKTILLVLLSAPLAQMFTLSARAQDPPTHATAGFRIGENTVEGFGDFLIPIAKNGSNLLLFNPRFSLKDEGSNNLSAGMVFRHLLDNESAILGANLFVDSRNSNHDNRYHQYGIGVELLTKWVDFRLNWYNADNRVELASEYTTQGVEVVTGVSRSTEVSGSTSERFISGASPVATGHQIAQSQNFLVTSSLTSRVIETTTTTTTTTNRVFQEYEAGLDGYDAEIGFRLPLSKGGPQVRLFAGLYDFDGAFGRGIKGSKGRVEVRVGPYLTLNAEALEDGGLNGSNYFLTAQVNIPLKGNNTLKHFRNGFRTTGAETPFSQRQYQEMVRRDVRVHIEESEGVEDPSRFSQVSQTERQVVEISRESSTSSATVNRHVVIATNINFVDLDNVADPLEDGTFEHPFDVIQEAAIDASVFGANSGNTTIFLCEAGGGICDLGGGGGSYDENVLLFDGQTITSQIIAAGGHVFETTNRPKIQPAAGFGPALDLTFASNVTVNRPELTTTGIEEDAILTDRSVGIGTTTISNNVITTTGDDAEGMHLDYDNGSSGSLVISNNVIVTSGEDDNGDGDGAQGIHIATGPTSTKTLSVSGNTITTGGEDSDGIDSDWEGSGNSVFSGNTIVTTGDDSEGLDIDNDGGDATTTISGNMITVGGEESDGIQTDNSGGWGSGIHNTIISGNTVVSTSVDDDIAGISTDNDTAGVTQIIGNTITTGAAAGAPASEGAFGISTDEDGSGTLLISGNTITTNADRAHAITLNNDGLGSTVVSGNIINTAGERAHGLRSDNNEDVGATVTNTYTGNTITTSGALARGIANVAGMLSSECANYSANTITTTNAGASAHGITFGAGSGVTVNAASSAALQAANTISVTGSGSTVVIGGASFTAC